MFEGILFSLFLSLAPPYPSPQKPVAMSKIDLNERFLLQVSYEQEHGLQDFMTSRSRIVDFKRQDKVLRMVEEPRDSATPPHLLATIPIRSETAQALMVDFNAEIPVQHAGRAGLHQLARRRNGGELHGCQRGRRINKRGIEDRLKKLQRLRPRGAMSLRVENERLVERPLIERAALRPGIVATAPQVGVTRILHDDEPVRLLVEVGDGHAHADPGEKARDGDVMPVLRPILPVVHEDERLGPHVHAPELATRATLFDGRDMDGGERLVRHAESVGRKSRGASEFLIF